jgi:hypothetical protein
MARVLVNNIIAVDVQQVIEDAVDEAYPIGSYYVQYPDAASNADSTALPVSQRPATLVGGTWAEVWDNEAVFFRTGGGNADETGSRSSGLQTDQMQRIFGRIGTAFGSPGNRMYARSTEGGTELEGVFQQGSASGDPFAQGSSSGTGRYINFNSSGSDNARTSSALSGETRSKNRRFRIWKRTA